ncbi:MAG TPA: hypothetical protein VMH33_03520 [Solirubrobacterales bacterium]|nr:hypothetical protein [Solirubrobacterales bacterium]
MRIKVWAFSTLVLALGAIAFFSAGATAKPTRLGGSGKSPPLKMLPNVGCEGLLTVADFPGTVKEIPGLAGILGSVEEEHVPHSSFFTTCQYISAEPTEADPEPAEHFGFDILSVYKRIEFESGGKRHNLLTVFPKLPGTTRFRLHGIGTRAYFEIDEEGDAVGYLQVRNDVFYVVKENAGGLRQMLATVASELCPKCNESEVPAGR